MERVCSEMGLSPHFFEATDMRNHTPEECQAIYDDKTARQKYGCSLVPSEVACASSHIRLWRHLIENDVEQALVLEDDIEILNPEALRQIISKPLDVKDWDLILFAHGLSRVTGMGHPTWHFHRHPIYQKYSLRRPIIRTTVAGALGYLITRRGEQRLIDQIPISEPIDNYTGRDQKINLYCLVPHIIQEAPIGAESTLEQRNSSISVFYQNSSLKKVVLKCLHKNERLRWFFIRVKSFCLHAHRMYNPFLKLRPYDVPYNKEL